MLMLSLQVGSLNERVINVAQKELHELYKEGQCDVYFKVEEERSGRGRGGSIQKWRFHVISKDRKVVKEVAETTDLAYMVNYFKRAWSDNTPLINKAIEAITKEGKVAQVSERLSKLKTRGVNNLGGYLRKVLVDEFGIKL